MATTKPLRRHRALMALLSCRTVEQASEQSGVSKATLYRWLADDAFQSDLTVYMDDAISQTIRLMSSSSTESAEILMSIIRDPETKPSSRVNAIRIHLSELRNLRDSHEINMRLTEVERRLDQDRQ